jgi:hypothetical protein
MRFLAGLMAGAMLLAGCAGDKRNGLPSSSTSGDNASRLIVTPDGMPIGRVVFFNEQGRFVVLQFPVGQMPTLKTQLNVYRGGLKVGEVKVNGPQSNDNIVADIVAGEARVGDEARPN